MEHIRKNRLKIVFHHYTINEWKPISVYIPGEGNVINIENYVDDIIKNILLNKNEHFSKINPFIKKFIDIIRHNNKTKFLSKKIIERNFFLINPDEWKSFNFDDPEKNKPFWCLLPNKEIVLLVHLSSGYRQVIRIDGKMYSDNNCKLYDVKNCKWQQLF